MALAALLKSVGISPDDIANAREQGQIIRQFIEATNSNTAAIVSRLAAIDNGLVQLRDSNMQVIALLQSFVSRVDSLAKRVEELHQAADLVE